MQAFLNRFAELLPYKPYCSNDLSKGVRVLPKEIALTRKYIQPQIPKRLVGWMIFDVDLPGAALAWESANLPPPTLTVVNPINSHAHLLYQLRSPIPTTDKSRMAPISFLTSVEHAFKLRLRADLGYAGLITKNPFSDAWRVSANDAMYDLSELAEYVELKPIAPRLAAGLGRNCTIFEQVRRYAYISVNKHDDHVRFNAEVLSLCYEIDSLFSQRLSDREVRGIAKSIAMWVWKRKGGLGGGVSIETIERIKLVANKLCPDVDVKFVCRVVQKQVAEAAGVSADTILRFLQIPAK